MRLVAAAAGSLGRNARAAAMSQQLVQLELDEKDKENFSELQQSMSQAQQELGRINGKLQLREREKRHAQFTLAELNEMDNSTRAYRQVGKMFLADDMPNLKDSLGQKIVACDKEVRTRRRPRAGHTSPHPPTPTRAPQVTALSEKRSHVAEALKKVPCGPPRPPAAAATQATMRRLPLRCKRIFKSSSRRTLSRWRRTRASERVWGRWAWVRKNPSGLPASADLLLICCGGAAPSATAVPAPSGQRGPGPRPPAATCQCHGLAPGGRLTGWRRPPYREHAQPAPY